MVKKSEINKKGRLAKSTLSVVLAASMVLTSSSFVWAAPVDDGNIAIISEEDVITDVTAAGSEEVVGDAYSDNSKISVSAETVTYNGTEQKPALTVAYEEVGNLTVDEDYEILSWGNNINAAKADAANAPYVKIRFLNNEAGNDYSGLADKTVNFAIDPADIGEVAAVSLSGQKAFVYTGTVKVPTVTVNTMIDQKEVTLAEGTDYELDTTADLVNKGNNKTVTVKGIGNYTGTVASQDTYEIQPTTLAQNMVDITTGAVAYKPGLTSDEVITQMGLTVTEKATEKPLDDYDVKYYNPDTKAWEDTALTSVGKHQLCIVPDGSGNFLSGTEGTIVADYTIVSNTSLEMIFKGATIGDFTGSKHEYDGSNHFVTTITTVAPYDSYTVNNDFVIVTPVSEWKDAGTYTVLIEGRGNFTGQTYQIPVEIEKKSLVVKETGVKADGVTAEAVIYKTRNNSYTAPTVTVEAGGSTLIKDQDYSYTIVGSGKDADILITGLGNYTTVSDKVDTLKVDVDVKDNEKLPFDDESIKFELKGTYTYNNGIQIKPASKEIVVTDTNANVVLVEGQDYKITGYGSNNSAGKETGSVTLTAIASSEYYTGSKTIKFDIAGKSLSSDFKLDPIDTITFANNTKVNTVIPVVRYVSDNAKYSDRYYTVEYYFNGKKIENPAATDLEIGAYTVKVIAQNSGYEGELETDFTVIGEPFSAEVVVSDIPDQSYTGKAIEPEFTIKDGGVVLVKDEDYTVKYDHNTDVGTAYITIQGIGKYSGTILKSFNIVGIDISEASVNVNGTYTYTGEAIVPTVVVKTGDIIIDPANYDIVATNNVNAGTATFTVTGKGGFTGTTKEASFEIGKADQKLAVSKATADALKIRNTNANTYTLKVTGAETKLTYKSSNTKVATVSAAGKLSFKHICGKATITVTAAADENHNAATLKVAVAVKPATPKITITSRTKGFNAKATVVKDITGYQVGYSRNKDFSPVTKKLVKTTKALNKNFSGLSAKKGYYVRVRAYKVASDGTVYWGNWTSAKKITTK